MGIRTAPHVPSSFAGPEQGFAVRTKKQDILGTLTAALDHCRADLPGLVLNISCLLEFPYLPKAILQLVFSLHQLTRCWDSRCIYTITPSLQLCLQ